MIAASTVNAAIALKRPELGSLKPGSVGDATILSVEDGRFDYVDVVGEHLTGDRRIAANGVVIAGRWWHPKFAASRIDIRVRWRSSAGMPFARTAGNGDIFRPIAA